MPWYRRIPHSQLGDRCAHISEIVRAGLCHPIGLRIYGQNGTAALPRGLFFLEFMLMVRGSIGCKAGGE